MNEENNAKRTLIIINIFVLIFIVSLIVILGIYYWDDIKLLATQEGQEEFATKIRSTGFLGFIIILTIQALQVVVAFIPGEFVEIISGMLFGTIGGLIVCLLGLIIGNIIIFGLIKLLGKTIIELNIQNKYQNKFKFLQNKTKALTILFFIYFIPGPPKDVITYFIPFTKIKMVPFIIVTSIARIPTIISSTLVGASIIAGNQMFALSVSIIMFVIGIIGLCLSNQITSTIEKIVNNIHENKNV